MTRIRLWNRLYKRDRRPYAGCSVALVEYAAAFLVAVGSDVTLTLRVYNRRHIGALHQRIRRNRFAWCMRSLGAYFLS